MSEFYAARARRYPRGWAVVVERIRRTEQGETKQQHSVVAGLTLEERDTWLRKVRQTPAHYWHAADDRRTSEAASRLGVGQGSVDVCKARRRRLDALPYAEDPEVQAFVREHPDGATLVEIGEWFGLTRERIRQLEAEALQSLAIALGRIGVREAPTSDIVSWCEGGSTWRTA